MSARPNLFIVGMPRSGTTSLTRYLNEHPAIYMSRRKEPMYHCSDLADPTRVRDESSYLALFDPGEGGAYRGEASPWYLYSEVAAASIAEMSPDARIIVSLRDPSQMVASLHAHHRYVGFEDEPDLERAVFGRSGGSTEIDFRIGMDYLGAARVGAQVARMVDVFPKEQVHFSYLQDMGEDAREVHLDILRFLGVEPIPLQDYPRHNQRRFHRSELVEHATKRLRGSGRQPKWRSMAATRLDRLNTAWAPDLLTPELRRRILAELDADLELLDEVTERDLSRWRIEQI